MTDHIVSYACHNVFFFFVDFLEDVQKIKEYKEIISSYVISSFRREVYENCTLLDYCVTSSCNPLPTFRDKISVPSSRV